MADWFGSGRAVDFILALVVAEGIALALLWRWTGHGPRPLAVLAFLVPGVCLLLAVRAALVGGDWIWIAFWLLAALAAHLVDLGLRWRDCSRIARP